MAKTLFEQMQAALAPDARLTTVATLVYDVRAALAEAVSERDLHHAIAVSAASDDATAEKAAEAEMKAARKVTRLEGQLAQIEARRDELQEAADRKRAQAEQDEITAERDALVADLKERWPVLAQEMLDLILRVEASDKRCKAVRILGAEAVANDVSWNYGTSAGPIYRIVEMDIPGMAGSAHLLREGDKHWAMR